MTTKEAQEKIGKLSRELSRTPQDAEHAEQRQALTDELAKVARDMPVNGRKGAFVTGEDMDDTRDHGSVSMKSLYARAARTDEEREVATGLDDALILSTMLKVRPDQTRFWQGLRERGVMRKAMDTSAASDWIPTEISAELHAQVRLQTRVASLLRTINMPTPTYKLPVQGDPAKAYLIAEASDPDADLDDSLRAKSSTIGLGAAQTLTARKVAVRVVPSVELTEDSIVPALALIKEEIVTALAQAQENAIVNGKRTGTLDSDVTTSDDVRHWFDGLSQIATGASQENGQAVFAAATAGRIEIGDLRKMRAKMGKYAINTSDCFWLTNAQGYVQLMGLTDANGNQLVTTVDKFGPNRATLVTGSISALDGFGIVLSEFVREDLNHAGFHDGVTTDASMVLLVNRKEFVFGSYRNPTLKSREVIETDQLSLVAMQRGDFAPFVPTKPACGFIYDVRVS